MLAFFSKLRIPPCLSCNNFYHYTGKAAQLPAISPALCLQMQEYLFFNVGRALALPLRAVLHRFVLADFFPNLQREM